MKKLNKWLLSLILATTTILTGCGFNIGNVTNFASTESLKYNEVDILSTLDCNVSLIPQSLKSTNVKDDKTYTINLGVKNKTDDEIEVKFDDVIALDNNQITLDNVDLDYTKKLALQGEEESVWTLQASGEDASQFSGFAFTIDDSKNTYLITVNDVSDFSYTIAQRKPEKEQEVKETQAEENKEEVATNELKKTFFKTSTSDYKTKWGSDEFGYVELDDTWQNFKTIDVDDKSQSQMLQYAKVIDFSSYYVVTLSSFDAKADDIINNIYNDDATNENASILYSDSEGNLEEDGYHLAMYEAGYEEPDYVSLLTIICIENIDSDTTHYLAFEYVTESADDFNIEDYFDLEEKVFETYSEILIVDNEYSKLDETSSISVETTGEDLEIITPSTVNSGNSLNTNSDSESYTLTSYDGSQAVKIYMPKDCTLNKEYTQDTRVVFDRGRATLWVTNYASSADIHYYKDGKYAPDDFSAYKKVDQELISSYITSYGEVVVLKYTMVDKDDFSFVKYSAFVYINDDFQPSVDGYGTDFTEEEFVNIVKEIFVEM